MQSEVLVGLGANLGDPVAQLCRAVTALRRWLEPLQPSALYRTEPVGFREQPDFLNLVCRGETSLGPAELLEALQEVERELGRERTFRNAPRTIDIDVLDFGGVVLDRHDLVLPHPRLHERPFVLVPLLEVAPRWRHPVLGRSAAELLAGVARPERVERWGALPGSC